MKKKLFVSILIFIFIAFYILSIKIYSSKNKELSVEKTVIGPLDTVVNIKLYGTDDEGKINKGMFLVDEIENAISSHIETSEVSALNRGEIINASPYILEVINSGIYYSMLSNGDFDISIGSLTGLWNFTDDTLSNYQIVPSKNAISEALKTVNYNNIVIKDNTIQVVNNSKIELGGIGKGYVADKLVEFYKKEKIDNALISLGGNIFAMGSKYGETPFKVGIKKPYTNENLGYLEVENKSIVSSGPYERSFTVDGKRYHHILDPETGYPANSDLLQTTIISDISADGDALSTITYILGAEKGMELIESLPNIECIFYTTNNEILKSSGINKKITFIEG
ncbi:MAG: FAD:protein FMN transferase [Lachnospirales bacterium]